MTETSEVVAFWLDGHLCGIDVGQVEEILRYQPITPIPHAQPAISGLLNLRGQIVMAVDLRQRLGLAPRPADQLPLNVVVRTLSGMASLLVDTVGDVVGIADREIDDLPPNAPAQMQQLVSGCVKQEDRLLLILDLERALQAEA